MNPQITKKQHYIPQFLLKNFSGDRRRQTINIFNLVDNLIEFYQPIKKRFQKEFFYDEDNLIENFLGNKIETPAAEVISSIVSQRNLEISTDKISKLLCFISSLLSRTPEALQQAKSMFNSHLNQVVRELLSLNNLEEDAAEEGRFVFDEQNLISRSAMNGAAIHLALDKLELALVINKSSTDFYISDHPVFDYNWFYRKSSHLETTSIFAKGLQIFFPISYDLTLCLYDPVVYKYGHRDRKVIELENAADIDILNSLQISNGKLHIGFRYPSMVPNLKQLHKRYGNRKIHKWETFEVSRREDSDEKKTTRIITVRRQFELNCMPSFVHIRKASRKDTDVFCLRNPLLAQAYYEQS